MAFTPTGNEGALNGTTNVDLVAAPGSGVQRIVNNIKINNKDSDIVTVIVEKLKGATAYEICTVDLDVDDKLILDSSDIEVLDATNESIRARLSAAATTTNPDFTASFADVS